MAQKNIVLLDSNTSPWRDFLKEFFEDTATQLHLFEDANVFGGQFSQLNPDILFINPEKMTLPLAQKINVFRQSSPSFRIFQIGESKTNLQIVWDDRFEMVPPLLDFQKRFVDHLPLPEKIRVMVIDDEVEIGAMIVDFLERRINPAFEVRYTSDGFQGLKDIEKNPPNVLVLDIKMPVKDGREIYKELAKKGLKIPVIVFFDSISGDEMVEIHKYGRPAVVEKGSRHSALPELMSLIKKLAYFG